MVHNFYKSACKFFRGDIPCKPHKIEGVHCEDCSYFVPVEKKILIIKLGAIGDVIRTTPLLHRLRNKYENSEIWWLTLTPEVLPNAVDKPLKFNLENVLVLQNTDFDVLINLDKDDYACALASSIKAKDKYGFWLSDGKPAPINELANHKFLTGLFDDVSKANTKSYLAEIFEIVGEKFEGEEYILDCDDSIRWEIPNNGKIIVGLNTGCGQRWSSRLWKEENWEKLIELLQAGGYFPMLLGGAQEHSFNMKLATKKNCYYAGHFSLKEFVALVNQCDLVVTAVTMALHIAIGLKKKVVLMNNIFNPNEFELYGRGIIVLPDKECKCYFSPTCNNAEYFCLDYLKPEKILNAIENLMPAR